MNEEERLLFLKEVNSDASLKKQFIEMKNIYAFSSLSEEPDCVERNQASYHSFMANKRKIRLFRSILHVFKYSAAILVGMVATYAVTLYTTKPEVVLVAMQSIHVPAGQRLQFTLQDGTTVWLNARTTLTFPNQFDEKERRVMVEGEALFDVAKDAGRPFIVSSKGVDMEVLGTKFNVYGYSEVGYLCVGLLSGSLNVYREDRKTEGANLQPNQQAMVGDGYFTVEPVPDPEHFLWTEGVYSFKNESLISILRKLELYFDIKIVVEDPDIYTWEYTGKFRQRDGIDGILHIIQKIHQFTIEKDDDTNTIILR
jgi:ferric-dicitrate binding protein FerR (iron transport regulator)